MGEDEGRYRLADVVGVVGVWITEPSPWAPGVEFEGLEWAFGKLSLYQWFAGVHLKVCTSRLVGCLV